MSNYYKIVMETNTYIDTLINLVVVQDQKPLKIIEDLIQVHSNENDTILDPFLGSGTTARACKDLGRKCIGIEISKKYCYIAIKRLGQEVFNFE